MRMQWVIIMMHCSCNSQLDAHIYIRNRTEKM